MCIPAPLNLGIDAQVVATCVGKVPRLVLASEALAQGQAPREVTGEAPWHDAPVDPKFADAGMWVLILGILAARGAGQCEHG